MEIAVDLLIIFISEAIRLKFNGLHFLMGFKQPNFCDVSWYENSIRNKLVSFFKSQPVIQGEFRMLKL